MQHEKIVVGGSDVLHTQLKLEELCCGNRVFGVSHLQIVVGKVSF